jgi:hypothetical protein
LVDIAVQVVAQAGPSLPGRRDEILRGRPGVLTRMATRWRVGPGPPNNRERRSDGKSVRVRVLVDQELIEKRPEIKGERAEGPILLRMIILVLLEEFLDLL